MSELQRPLPPGNGTVSQGFGENPEMYKRWKLAGHNGIDYACPVGVPVLAAHEGHVALINDPAGYGLAVRLTGEHIITLYAHLDSIAVAADQVLETGMVIGRSGNTGNSTGPHLHFGVQWVHGVNPAYRGWVDPLPLRLLAPVRRALREALPLAFSYG
jgi:murein DD-endopeptidase MepM/ murein hydrolase activator NlpD